MTIITTLGALSWSPRNRSTLRRYRNNLGTFLQKTTVVQGRRHAQYSNRTNINRLEFILKIQTINLFNLIFEISGIVDQLLSIKLYTLCGIPFHKELRERYSTETTIHEDDSSLTISIGPPLTCSFSLAVLASFVTSTPVMSSAGCKACNSSDDDRVIATNLAPACVTSSANANPNPRLHPVMATRFPFRYDGSYTVVISKYRWLFSFLARAKRATWSANEYRESPSPSADIWSVVVVVK